MAKITGGTPPDLEQDSPISEVPLSQSRQGVNVLVRLPLTRCEIQVIKRDPQTMKHAPSVLKDPTATPRSKRKYSTLTGFGDGAAGIGRPTDIPPVQVDVDINPKPVLPEGAKYPLPNLPLPPTSILRKRYPPVVEQVTNLIMRDGKV